MKFPDYKTEEKYFGAGYEYVIGCDEAGRGPLAGPVVAAACILNTSSLENDWHARVRDSKTISETEREFLAGEIYKNSLAWGIGKVSSEEIDKVNIHQATLRAMRQAVENLKEKISAKKVFVLVDGKFAIPDIEFSQTSVVKGDSSVLSIAAASIIAKVHRDNIMRDFDKKFPEYGFAKHKGYGTKEHYRSIQSFGISPVHRKSFL